MVSPFLLGGSASLFKRGLSIACYHGNQVCVLSLEFQRNILYPQLRRFLGIYA